MGNSSLKKILFWKKKKKSPLSNAFRELKRALPKKKKKSKKKSILKQLHQEKLKKDKKSKKKFALIPLTRDKKAPKSTKILSLGKERKKSDPNTSEGQKEKDREGLARVGDKIKKTFSPESKKEPSPELEVAPLKETHEGKISLQKLKDIMKPRRQSETNAN
ncbi:muscle M-line assembly protein unc-89-like [Poecilia formosa]|uniref:muscle M-line assembly protein unc-89-like n=1 Tax=Poecilia formosa TaxID=48698 RepID=UPI0004447781|nr:PREDICTED: muscle M-line assembly protein unc-89-like [Poecilia formosa]